MSAQKEENTILQRPFEEVSNAQAKEAIVAKFGSLAHFCRLSGRKLSELNQNLRYRTEHSTPYLAAAFEDAGRLANVKAEGYHLTPQLRKDISARLLSYASILDFCEAHPEFSNVFVSRVTNGGIQKVTKKVRALAAALKIEVSQPTK